jgi:predicted phage terminase large subunit-like protein
MGRHHALVDRELVRVAQGLTKRLIVEMPPRHGKSLLAAKFFTAWYRGTFPDRNVLIASATHPLASKWTGEARDLLGEHGPSLFGVHLRDDKQAAGEWALDEGGETRAVGVGGSPFGFGFHLGVVDDYFGSIEQALSPSERERVHRWFQGTFRNRLEDESTGAIVILATRYHKDDLVGRLLREQEHGGDQWRHIRLPALAEENDPLGREIGEALWPAKWSKAYLEGERQSLAQSGYPWMYDALYQQDPPEIIDSEWPEHYFDEDAIWYEDKDRPADEHMLCRSIAIDPSLGKSDKSDYSAIVYGSLDRSGVFWIDADIQRRPAPQIATDAVRWHHAVKPHAMGCEVVQMQELVGTLIQQEAAKLNEEIWLLKIPADGEKKVRIRRLSPYLAKGQIRFRRHSPGCNLLVEQLKGFPSHKFKDGPDALEMVIRQTQAIVSGAVVQFDPYEEQAVA